jgi:hypothetical protein
VPVEGLPTVRTLAEMYDLDRRYRGTAGAKAGVDEAVLREVWMRGAGAVVLNLLRFVQGDAPETNPDDPVARVLEAWDAEVLKAVVDQAMVAEKFPRSDCDAP